MDEMACLDPLRTDELYETPAINFSALPQTSLPLPLNSWIKSLRPVLGELVQFTPKLQTSAQDIL